MKFITSFLVGATWLLCGCKNVEHDGVWHLGGHHGGNLAPGELPYRVGSVSAESLRSDPNTNAGRQHNAPFQNQPH